jgi:Na+/H+ antiporter NhaA
LRADIPDGADESRQAEGLVPIVPSMPPRYAEAFRAGVGDARSVHSAAVRIRECGRAVRRIGPGTYYVVAALLLGKPIGILLFTGAARHAGAQLASGLRLEDLLVMGIAASIGFTVSMYFATAAFPEGAALAETKMGAPLSFLAAPLAIATASLLRVSPRAARRRDEY